MALHVVHRFTDRRHGDLAPDADPATLRQRRGALAPEPWTWLRQVHGAEVVTVTRPGQWAGAVADAAVTSVPGAVLAIQTADCAPLLLIGHQAIGVAHVGWRGLAAGVIEATAAAMADLGDVAHRGILGPCIRSRCYEFGADDLDVVAERYGPAVRSRTATGSPSLDVAAGISVACERLAIDLTDQGTCTACSPVHWSHRAQGDPHRQALVAWLEEDPAGSDRGTDPAGDTERVRPTVRNQ